MVETMLNERAAPLGGLDDDRQGRHAGDDPVPSREVPGRYLSARVEFGNQRSLRGDSFRQATVSGRVHRA